MHCVRWWQGFAFALVLAGSFVLLSLSRLGKKVELSMNPTAANTAELLVDTLREQQAQLIQEQRRLANVSMSLDPYAQHSLTDKVAELTELIRNVSRKQEEQTGLVEQQQRQLAKLSSISAKRSPAENKVVKKLKCIILATTVS